MLFVPPSWQTERARHVLFTNHPIAMPTGAGSGKQDDRDKYIYVFFLS